MIFEKNVWYSYYSIWRTFRVLIPLAWSEYFGLSSYQMVQTRWRQVTQLHLDRTFQSLSSFKVCNEVSNTAVTWESLTQIWLVMQTLSWPKYRISCFDSLDTNLDSNIHLQLMWKQKWWSEGLFGFRLTHVSLKVKYKGCLLGVTVVSRHCPVTSSHALSPQLHDITQPAP